MTALLLSWWKSGSPSLVYLRVRLERKRFCQPGCHPSSDRAQGAQNLLCKGLHSRLGLTDADQNAKA